MITSTPTTVDYLQHLLEQPQSMPGLLITDQSALSTIAETTGTLCLTASQALCAHHEGTLPKAATAVVDGNALFEQSALVLPLISQLRDVLAARVFVIAASKEDAVLRRSALISLGFHRAEVSVENAGKRPWYIFEMAHYKVTPDWLNARHWANPELWDKFRW